LVEARDPNLALGLSVINIPPVKYICHPTEKSFGYRLPNFEAEPRSMMQVHREESGNELEQTWRQRLRHALI
jgi:hypothetical protein